jgi:hypothetical protein
MEEEYEKLYSLLIAEDFAAVKLACAILSFEPLEIRRIMLDKIITRLLRDESIRTLLYGGLVAKIGCWVGQFIPIRWGNSQFPYEFIVLINFKENRLRFEIELKPDGNFEVRLWLYTKVAGLTNYYECEGVYEYWCSLIYDTQATLSTIKKCKYGECKFTI